MYEPIDVQKLPEASTFLNYPGQGPPVGKYLGPNTMGEYLTVVSNSRQQVSWAPMGSDLEDPDAWTKLGDWHRVGLAYGCYTIDGQPTDPDGFPPVVAAAEIRREWQALKR